MSQYTSYQYETEPEPEVSTGALAAAAGVAGLIVVGTASLAVRSLRSMQEQAEKRMEELDAMGEPSIISQLGALNESPLLEAAVLKEFAQESRMLDAGRETVLAQMQQVEDLKLDHLIHKGNARLLQGQARVLRDSMTDVLTELGYKIRTPRLPLRDVVVVKGVREEDNTSVSIRLTSKDDKLEPDLHGFNGGACTQLLAEFDEGMRRRGVKLKMIQREPHGCAGGRLTQDVNRVLNTPPVEVKKPSKKQARKVRASAVRPRVRS